MPFLRGRYDLAPCVALSPSARRRGYVEGSAQHRHMRLLLGGFYARV